MAASGEYADASTAPGLALASDADTRSQTGRGNAEISASETVKTHRPARASNSSRSRSGHFVLSVT